MPEVVGIHLNFFITSAYVIEDMIQL